MEKIMSLFGKTDTDEPRLESVGDTGNRDYGYEDADFDEPVFEGVGDSDGFGSNPGYNNQVQTEMFRPKRRRWGESEFTFRPQDPVATTNTTGVDLDRFVVQEFTGENMMYVEQEAMEALSRDIQTLGEIAQDMSILLDDQSEMIDKVDENVNMTMVHVEKADAEVQETLRLMKSAKFKRGLITTTGCTAIGAGIGVLGGPPGIAIGAGIGGAVGVLGSTVASIVGD
jgi:hypothetical protein